MTEHHSDSFDETLLSAYLDDELTQAESQRVRLHLEECESCSGVLEQMKEIREATMSTPFPSFDDAQWDERPRGLTSRVLRGVGWAMIVIWLAGVSFLGFREFLEEPGVHWWEAALAVGLIGGGLFLFLSVLLDRLSTLKTDRYRRIQK